MPKGGKMSRTTGASTSKQLGGGTLHLCDVCGKTFPFKVVLDMHKKDHIIKNVYKCEVCGTAYPKKSQLEMHVRKHTGERPFKCDECDASFMNGSNLQRHKRKHVCKRRYDSDEWEAAYALSDNLSAEKRARDGARVEGESPYTCEECEESFPDTKTLVVHKRKHTKDRPFMSFLCELCGATFSVRASLEYHNLKHGSLGGEASYWHNNICGEPVTSKDGLAEHQHKDTDSKQLNNYEKMFVSFINNDQQQQETEDEASAITTQQQQQQPQLVPQETEIQQPKQMKLAQLQQEQQQQQHDLSDQQLLTQHSDQEQYPQVQQHQGNGSQRENIQASPQLHELQPPSQIHQIVSPSHLPLSQPPQGNFSSSGVSETQVPGPMGPQAQPVQNNSQDNLPDDSIKDEPRE